MSAESAAGLQKILLVEDDQLIREMYQLFLKDKGYIVGTAGDGEEALQVVRSFRPELIFLDIMMPKLNGLEVLKILRSDPSYGCTTCKIVLLTNLGDDTIAEHVKGQIDGYAIKAEITLSDLVDIITSLQ
ncbi:MAG: response regulator [Candidatus Saccharibacteria bacterium]